MKDASIPILFATAVLALASIHMPDLWAAPPPKGGGAAVPVYQQIAIGQLYGVAPCPLAVHVTSAEGLIDVQCVGYVVVNGPTAFSWEATVDPLDRTSIATMGVQDVNTMATNGWGDLSDPTAIPSGWSATVARGVNSSGEIACDAKHTNGHSRACVFDPVTKQLMLLPVPTANSTSHIAIGEPINSWGDIVYSATNSAGDTVTAVCDGTNGSYSEYLLPSPLGISDDGRIVGGAYNDGYAYRYTLQTDAIEILNAIAPSVSPNGQYVLAKAGVARRYTSPTAYVSVSGKSQADPTGGVNSNGDCSVRVFESRSRIWNAFYRDGSTFNINTLAGLPSDNRTDIYGISERDNTSLPWFCGCTSVSGEAAPLLLMPIK